MPSSVALYPHIIPVAITASRLDSYRSVFSAATDHELVGCYLWNQHVCSAMYPLLSSVEITIRNSIDRAIAPDLGHFWWRGSKLHYKSFVPHVAPPQPVQSIRDNFSKATLSVKKDRRKRYPHLPTNLPPLHDDIVAKTDFSTWEFMLDQEFLGPSLIWQSKLGQVLKGKWPSPSLGNTLSHAQNLTKTVRELRNRVSHSEPVWKRYGILNETDALAYLNEKIDTIEEIVVLFSPEKLHFLEKNNILKSARRLCTQRELERIKKNGPIFAVNSFSRLQNLVKNHQNAEGGMHIKLYAPGKRRFVIFPE
ncbi:hypothetical protein V6R98_14465 [Agrobacterium sp. CCNWLW71]|uniref:hypothetical protein n=1 Tax=unclassified Agrobacterium TaxID=2632611 RepID=UPI002FF1FA8B